MSQVISLSSGIGKKALLILSQPPHYLDNDTVDMEGKLIDIDRRWGFRRVDPYVHKVEEGSDFRMKSRISAVM